MSTFFQRNKLAVYIGTGILIFLLLIGLVVFTLGKPNKNSEDPSVANDARIRKEQEVRMTNQATVSPTSQNQNNQPNGQPDLGNANSSDPLEKGKALAGGNCTGTGSKKLGSAPMRTEEMSVIIPYGLLAGGHVTPIDHQYYWGKNQFGDPDMYDVLSPGEGKLVNLQYRNKASEGKKVKGDYRGVIMYSCTFFSYFDLVTSLSPEIQAQLPPNWETKGGTIGTDILLKEGQVVGKVGAQSLDFAIWDTTKSLQNLLIPTAYNNAEPWKINTVPPLDYFSDSVKAKILPFYANQSYKNDGTIDQDIEGKAAGNWFLEGTNGYAGVFEYGPNGGGGEYWKGHLALVHDHVDPNGWIFSTGNLNGNPQQYAVKSPSITPDKLDISSGIVKYELTQWNHIDDKGQSWVGGAPAKNIKMSPGQTKGTALVQLMEGHRLKIEIFPNKIPSQVTGFTSAAQFFDRGDHARMIMSNTAN